MNTQPAEILQELFAEAARTEQIAINAASTLYLSGRWSDLCDEELDALVAMGQCEQRERDERRTHRATDECPF